MSEQDLHASPEGSSVNVPAVRRKPSATRAVSNARTRRVELLGQGRAAAWRHGTFATVGNSADVTIEHALIIAANPSLDPIIDHRLVEDLALARAQRNRAMIALESEGMTSTLTSYLSRLMPLVERLERAVHERARERVKDFRARPLVDLSQYRANTHDPEEDTDR